jgi:hypothetical protein
MLPGNAEVAVAEGVQSVGDLVHQLMSHTLHCAGHEKTPRSWPCRLVYLTAYLTAAVLLAAYSATFISFLAVRHSAMPFNTFEEMLRDGSYQLGILERSVELSIFDVSITLFTKQKTDDTCTEMEKKETVFNFWEVFCMDL